MCIRAEVNEKTCGFFPNNNIAARMIFRSRIIPVFAGVFNRFVIASEKEPVFCRFEKALY